MAGISSVSITAIGKQWSWDFQYNGEEADNSDAVWTMGTQAQPDKDGHAELEAFLGRFKR